jgi:hypothetical protein
MSLGARRQVSQAFALTLLGVLLKLKSNVCGLVVLNPKPSCFGIQTGSGTT